MFTPMGNDPAEAILFPWHPCCSDIHFHAPLKLEVDKLGRCIRTQDDDRNDDAKDKYRPVLEPHRVEIPDMVKRQGVPQDSERSGVKRDDKQYQHDTEHSDPEDLLAGCEVEIKDNKFVETVFQVFEVSDPEYQPAEEDKVLRDEQGNYNPYTG